jgi:hypothetical protein
MAKLALISILGDGRFRVAGNLHRTEGGRDWLGAVLGRVRSGVASASPGIDRSRLEAVVRDVSFQATSALGREVSVAG